GEERLSEHIVDLVRAGMGEVLALEDDPNAEALGETPALGDGRRPARVRLQEPGELATERVGSPRGSELAFELLERGDEALGHEPTAESVAEASERGGLGSGRVEMHGLTARERGHWLVTRRGPRPRPSRTVGRRDGSAATSSSPRRASASRGAPPPLPSPLPCNVG